ncbi:hypothetical protein LCGC14_2064940 [marine sediment metagenome]|uniref:Uncharacterized protein n=1 Tax=marine sediment metagenome TaxID=412755 RepID=A0A0F9GYK4_9ZZZZ
MEITRELKKKWNTRNKSRTKSKDKKAKGNLKLAQFHKDFKEEL